MNDICRCSLRLVLIACLLTPTRGQGERPISSRRPFDDYLNMGPAPAPFEVVDGRCTTKSTRGMFLYLIWTTVNLQIEGDPLGNCTLKLPPNLPMRVVDFAVESSDNYLLIDGERYGKDRPPPDDITLSDGANIIKWVVANDTLPAADAIGNGTNATNVPWTIRRPAFDTLYTWRACMVALPILIYFNVMCYVRSLPLFLAAVGGIFFLTIWFAQNFFLSKHGWVYWEGDDYFYWPSIWYSFIVFVTFLGCMVSCYTRVWCKNAAETARRRRDIDGELIAALWCGDVKLVNTWWILAQRCSFIIKRRQDLPFYAFVPNWYAVFLLRQGRVAAVSHRWFAREHPDLEGFTARAVRHFLTCTYPMPGCMAYMPGLQPGAIFWDYASLPQHGLKPDQAKKHGLKPGQERNETEKKIFNRGKDTMGLLYASPDVLVLQQKRKPKGYEFHPDTAQTYDESGWCTFEAACANLTTDNGKRLFELGVGWKRTSVDKRLTPHEMSAKMRSDAIKFTGKGDADLVSKLYKDLHEKVVAFEQSDGRGNPCTRWCDGQCKHEGKKCQLILLFYLVNAVGVALLYIPFRHSLLFLVSGTFFGYLILWCPVIHQKCFYEAHFWPFYYAFDCLTMQSCVGGVLGWPLLVRHLFPCASSRVADGGLYPV